MTKGDLDRLVGVGEAAALCGVSDDSIRRRLKSGTLRQAQFESGRWLIPVSDLVRVGLRPRLLDDATMSPASSVASAPKAVQSELVSLREQLIRMTARAAAAEALAEARAEHITDLRARLGRGDQLSLFASADR